MTEFDLNQRNNFILSFRCQLIKLENKIRMTSSSGLKTDKLWNIRRGITPAGVFTTEQVVRGGAQDFSDFGNPPSVRLGDTITPLAHDGRRLLNCRSKVFLFLVFFVNKLEDTGSDDVQFFFLRYRDHLPICTIYDTAIYTILHNLELCDFTIDSLCFCDYSITTS